MTERDFPEKHGVIFGLWDRRNIQLEVRVKIGDKFFGYTIIPGGGIEEGETIQEALIREIAEEYGVRAEEFKKIGTVFQTEEEFLNVRHVYLVTKWKGQLGNPEAKNDHTALPIERAYDECKHPLSRIFLRMIEDELSRDNS